MMSGASAPVAAQSFVVGVAAPLSGPSALLGRQVSDGASVAAAAQALPIPLKIVDDTCTGDGGAAAAHAFVDAKVAIVVGFLCTEAIEAALPILKDAAIPVLTIGVRTDSLTDRREKTGWPLWRLGPRADSEQAAVGDILSREWRDKLFAIVDDGTIYGRELAETLRSAAERTALKPVFIDTFRPQLDNQIGLAGRLRKSGATHVFVGGDRDDIAILGRDAAGLGMPLVIAGGEALRSAPNELPLAVGTLMVALPEWSDTAPQDVLAQFERVQATVDGYALPAYAAVQIASAVGKATSEGRLARDILGADTFATVLGPLAFDAKGDLSANPYQLFRFDGTRFARAQ